MRQNKASVQDKNVMDAEKETIGNFTTALFWVVAAGPVVSALLFPGYFAQDVKFPQSLLAYIVVSVAFYVAAGIYMVLVAVCRGIEDNKIKNFSIIAVFAVCAFLFCMIQSSR